MSNILVIGIISLFAVYISGCGPDDTQVVQEDIPVSFVLANPPTSSPISPLGPIILTFDGIPTNLSVTPGIIEARDGRKVTVVGPFSPGPLEMRITWTNGGLYLQYYVLSPCADEDTAEDTECF